MPGRLRPLLPFSQLPAEQLIVAASRTLLKRFRDGDLVLARGSDDTHDYFLLDGNVVLHCSDGKSRLVASGSALARDAIAPLRPCLYDVRALGPVVCAKMARTELAVLREHVQQSNGVSLTEVVAAATGPNPLLEEIEADLAADRLKLPSLPEVSLRIRSAVASARCDSRHIAGLLGADPAVAAKILKIANSPLCRGAATISKLHDAVNRIGINIVSELVVCFSLKDLFKTDLRALRERFADISGAAVRIGATASVIATRVAPGATEQALVAGLLSNVGALPLLARIGAQSELVTEPAKVDALLAELSPRVGELICRKWNLGEPIIEAVRCATDWTHVGSGTPTLAEIVICARYHMLVGIGQGQRLPRPESIPAMRILGPEPTPAVSMEIIREAKTRIEALLEALV